MKPSYSKLLLIVLCMAPPALASTWYVDGVNGSDSNSCKTATTACQTIGHAISLALSGDAIKIAASTYSENLNIASNLKLEGASAATTIIDGGQAGRVFTIADTGAKVGLSKLTMRNGLASGGGGILNWGTLTVSQCVLSGNIASSETSAVGGAILNSGTLTITQSTLTANSGASLYIYGGAVYSSGKLTITSSTLSGNTLYATVGGGGGAIYSGTGSTSITNSTISGNTASGSGGGGLYVSGGTAKIASSTFSGNSGSPNGGDIYNAGTVTLQNSLVVGSTGGGNCYGTMTSKGYNMSSDSTCNFSAAGDRNGTDPKLGALQNNGGPTLTMALPKGSPAIDAGNPSGCTDTNGHLLKTDQRGQSRHDKEDASGCDIGAYESATD